MSFTQSELEDLEINLLLEAVYHRYGFDFRDYAIPSLRRRILKCVQDEKTETISGLQNKILHQSGTMRRFIDIISVDVTAMFRDPGFYAAFRNQIVPLLKDNPLTRIWHVGCASGEEVYSMAILLKEEGLYEKCRLYATDMNESLLKEAREGIYPLKQMRGYTDNYQKAGGKSEFSSYYTAEYDHAVLQPALSRNIIWAQHNLVSDTSFNEFDVILCRNVLIYFNNLLQTRVHELLYSSLVMDGILVLGAKESLTFTPREEDYVALHEKEKIYKKVR